MAGTPTRASTTSAAVRHGTRGRRRRSLAARILGLAAAGLAASASPAVAAQITLQSGTGSVGGLDASVQVVADAGPSTSEPRPANIVPPAATYAAPVTSSKYVSITPEGTGLGESATLTTSFTLPPGALAPTLSIALHADNRAVVALNSATFASQPAGCPSSNFQGAPETFSTSSGFVAGTNTLTFKLENPDACGAGPTALDFVATVSYQPGKDDTALISRASGASGTKGLFSQAPSVSADGRYVVFTTTSKLDPSDQDALRDVYRRDTLTDQTVLVNPQQTGGHNSIPGSSTDISADGRYVAYRTRDNAAGCPSDGGRDCILVRDMQAAGTTLASRVRCPCDFSVSMSDDGRYVAFETDEPLDPADSNGTGVGATDVYVRDLVAGTTTLASRPDGLSGPAGPGAQFSLRPSLSGDGRRVAFTNTGAFGAGASSDVRVHVRDLDANTTTLASRADGAGGATVDDASHPVLAADGRHVSFTSADLAGGDTHMYVRDLPAGTTEVIPEPDGALVGRDGSPLSGDGRYAAISVTVPQPGSGPVRRVYHVDRLTSTLTLASRASGANGAPANGESGGARGLAMSANGRFVAFGSLATNLSAADTDTSPDVFGRDVLGLDVTAPQTTITAGPSGLTTDTTPTFAFTSNEAGATFECRVDNAVFAACASAHTTAALKAGAHTFQVRARDAAGNVDATPALRRFTVDTPPQTTITGGPSGPTADQMPTFTFSSSEAGSSFECRVDRAPFAACGSPHTTGYLNEGAHTFQVRATDATGNVDATPALRRFTVDTGPV